MNLGGKMADKTAGAKNPHQSLEVLNRELVKLTHRDFAQDAICRELLEIISSKFSTAGLITADIPTWVKANYPQGVETLFHKLFEHCSHYALKLISDPEMAQDIAQDCIKELLDSKQEIKDLKAWLSRVTHNKVVASFKAQKKEAKLVHGLKQLPQEITADPDDDDFHITLRPEEIKKMLSPIEFRMYNELYLKMSLQEYAQAHGISYQTAKEHKHRIKVNLRSAYLKDKGYRNTKDILSYQQLRSLNCFVRKLDKLKEGKSSLGVRHPQLKEYFQSYQKIHEWNITLFEKDVYDLVVVLITNATPEVIVIKFKFNRAHRITILKIKKAQLIASMPENDSNPLVLNKGKVELNRPELLRILPHATVHNQELFDELMQKLTKKPDSL